MKFSIVVGNNNVGNTLPRRLIEAWAGKFTYQDKETIKIRNRKIIRIIRVISVPKIYNKQPKSSDLWQVLTEKSSR